MSETPGRRRRLGGRGRKRAEPREGEKRKHRWIVWSAAGVVVVAAAVSVRAATETIPPTTVRLLLSRATRLPGPPAQLAWPAHGEAALSTGAGVMIGTSGSDSPVPIASVTKVMTAYVVLRDHPLSPGQQGPTFTITAREAAHLAVRRAEGQSLLAVTAGQTFTELQALQALLLPSADNMAAALARFDAGTRGAFVAKMNAEAAALGMRHTHFADPSGFDPGSVSNATDLLLLARAAMAVPAFAAVVDERHAVIPGVARLANYNSLVGTDGFDGIKTGSTGAAGQALLFSVRRRLDGSDIDPLGLVLEQHGPGVVTGALDAARTLADSFYSGLEERAVLAAGTPVAALHRAGRTSLLSTTRPLRVIGLRGSTVHLDTAVGGLPTASPSPPAQVQAVTSIGRAYAPVAGRPPAPPGIAWRLENLF